MTRHVWMKGVPCAIVVDGAPRYFRLTVTVEPWGPFIRRIACYMLAATGFATYLTMLAHFAWEMLR